MVKQVDGRIREIQDILGDVKKATAELPELIFQTQQTIEGADEIMTDLRSHWLLRRLAPPSRIESPIEISQRQNPHEKKGDAPR